MILDPAALRTEAPSMGSVPEIVKAKPLVLGACKMLFCFGSFVLFWYWAKPFFRIIWFWSSPALTLSFVALFLCFFFFFPPAASDGGFLSPDRLQGGPGGSEVR